MNMTTEETILEPDLPIIDPHHHLWDLRPVLGAFPEPLHPFLETVAGAAHYTFDQLQVDTQSGHRVVGTVFMECGAFYDPSRGEDMKVVGEVEFVRGVAAQGASGLYGPYRPVRGSWATRTCGSALRLALCSTRWRKRAAPVSRVSDTPAPGMRTPMCWARPFTIPKGSTATPPFVRGLQNWANGG